MLMFVSNARYINELSVNYTNTTCLLILTVVYGHLSFLMHRIELVKQRLGRVIFLRHRI